jgi:hypothetical protein
MGDMTTSTGVSAPVCSPTRARACLHRFGQERQSFGPAVACTGMCAPATKRGRSNTPGGKGQFGGTGARALCGVCVCAR